MEIQRELAVCFTGHRPNKVGGYNESAPKVIEIKQRLENAIKMAIAQGKTTFISGMALGVDTWAAEIVIAMKDAGHDVKLVAAIPFEGQERMWPQQSQARWRAILERADTVEYVCEAGYAPRKMQKRNEWMVDHASIVIAVWDGTTGGTGNCVNYAKKAAHQPRVWRIDPTKTPQQVNVA